MFAKVTDYQLRRPAARVALPAHATPCVPLNIRAQRRCESAATTPAGLIVIHDTEASISVASSGTKGDDRESCGSEIPDNRFLLRVDVALPGVQTHGGDGPVVAVWLGKAIMRRQTLAAVFVFTPRVLFSGCTDDPTAPRTGALRVTTSTTGDTLDWNGYALIVGAAVPRAIGIDATVLITNLLPGDVTVELGDVAVNCSVSGDNPREVGIVAGVETETRFEIDCQAALFDRIAFSSKREGGASDIFVMEPDGSKPINLTRDPSSPASYPAWSQSVH